MRVVSPGTDQRISRSAGTVEGLDEKEASRGTVLRLRVGGVPEAKARKLESAKVFLSATVVVVPAGMLATALRLTKTTSMASESRRLSTSRSWATFDAADLMSCFLLRSMKNFMPLTSGTLSNHAPSGSAGLTTEDTEDTETEKKSTP